MRIDFQARGAWQQLNEDIERRLGLNRDGAAKVFWGLSQALLENLISAARQFPLKKKVYFFRSLDPVIDGVMKHLAREGLSLQPMTLEEFRQPESWIATIGKDTLAVVAPVDDVFFGRRHDVSAIHEALKAQRILQIFVSHGRHRIDGRPIVESPFDLHLLNYSADICLGLFGERARLPHFMTETLPWTEDMHRRIVEILELAAVPERKDLIRRFESQGLAGARPHFALDDSDRLFDRAVVYWEDMDATAMIEELAERLSLPLLPPGMDANLETPSLSRWGGIRDMDWLVQQGFTAERVRGTVVIAADLIERADFAPAFQAARERILELQGDSPPP